MKVISLRIFIAADDDVTLTDIKPRLQELIVAQGTEIMNGEAGNGQRIHWGTADIIQGADRMTPQPKRGPAKRPPIDQPALLVTQPKRAS